MYLIFKQNRKIVTHNAIKQKQPSWEVKLCVPASTSALQEPILRKSNLPRMSERRRHPRRRNLEHKRRRLILLVGQEEFQCSTVYALFVIFAERR